MILDTLMKKKKENKSQIKTHSEKKKRETQRTSKTTSRGKVKVERRELENVSNQA